jgi:hypothetical protein
MERTLINKNKRMFLPVESEKSKKIIGKNKNMENQDIFKISDGLE